MKLNPGSPEAIKQGCTCPVLDNDHGDGFPGRGHESMFWVSRTCPIHGDKKENGNEDH